MRINAAVLWTPGTPLTVEEVELDPPRHGEVLVEVKAAGVCHSDLHPARGDWPMRTPLVLGHEGAGIVREIGPGVAHLRPGDHVVFCWAPACGACPYCASGHAVVCDRLDRTTYRNRLPSGETRLHARGQDVNHFISTACFADWVVLAEEGAIRVDRDISFDALATVGCAVVTGVGAVLNGAQVAPGSTVVVVGAGGVGLNVIQGARVAQAARIIAADVKAVPLSLARDFGATETIDLTEATLSDAVRAATQGAGADYVFDTVGSAATLPESIAAVRKRGTVILTGLSRVESMGPVPTFPLVMQEKRLIGSVYGSGSPARDIARIVSLYREGRLKLRELVSRTYVLGQVNDALDALANAAGARGVIVWE